jgi:preprotein translocase SecE subunit
MGVKNQTQSEESKKSMAKSMFDFIGDVKEEIGKIAWTPQDELKVYTKAVVGTTFVLGIAIYCMDLIIQGTLAGLHFIVRFISG